MMKRIALILLTYLFIMPTVWADGWQRSNYIQAMQALERGNLHRFNELRAGLSDYVLHPYLDYAEIKKRIKSAPESQIESFVQRYPDSWVGDDIVKKWLPTLAEEGQWHQFMRYYSERFTQTKLRCQALEARYYSGDEGVLVEAESIWMSGEDRPEACNGVFGLLMRNGYLTPDKYWQRIGLAMDKRKVSLSNYLARQLPVSMRKWANLWTQAYKNPSKVLAKRVLREDNAYSRDVIVYALERLARKDHHRAAELWQRFQQTHAFSEEQKADAEGGIAYRAAREHDSFTVRRLSDSSLSLQSNDARAWRARISLRDGNWPELLDVLNAMPHEQAEKDVWTYWKGRALKAMNDQSGAAQHFSKLSNNATFYGFLSADQLGEGYGVLNQGTPNRSALMARVQSMPAIQRAFELFSLGEDSQANREWYWALERMDKESKLAAAELALQHRKANLAIVTVSKTRDWNVVDLRFPVLHQNLVHNAANDQGISSAWVYGIMRRESAFNESARSSAKALGLMQLLPSTARLMGKRLGLGRLSHYDILEPANNVQLGSAYLSNMLDRFDGHYPKATAAYNAGPGRIPRWLPRKTIEADQWIESIPFTETRRYVRTVMAYTTIYDHKLDGEKADRMSRRLFPVAPDY